MKKATAFLTLIGLLTVLGSVIYAVKFHPDQQQLTPLITAMTDLVPEQYRSPGLIGLILFWLAAFVTSLAGLFGSSAEKQPVKTEEKPEPKPISPPEEQPETVLKSEFSELERKFQQLEEQKLQKEKQLESEVENLQAQLQKFSVSDEDSQKQEKLAQELAELKQQVEKFQSENENLVKSSTNADAEIKKLEEEIRALQNKLNKAEEDCKTARREAEKAAGSLKTAQADNEKFKQQLEEMKQENEKIKAELQAAMADAKSGKHGIPPAAYQILYLFQKEGRLIDLLMEDVTDFDDETLGGAIRPIHEGCRKLLQERLIIEPVLNESEGSEVTIEEADAESIKLSGNVPARGPYTGELVHRGWRLKECHLPELVDGWSGNVVAPAEIEIS
jgi:DNA repair exonuclease SbcCD ATPase subunit